MVFRYPAYDDRSNIILMLPTLDHPDAALDYNTTLAACAIVANNAWCGFFTLDRAGEPYLFGLANKVFDELSSEAANIRTRMVLWGHEELIPAILQALSCYYSALSNRSRTLAPRNNDDADRALRRYRINRWISERRD